MVALSAGGLLTLSCDNGTVTEEHMNAERALVGINWQISEIYLRHAATGQQEWRPVSDSPLKLSLYFRNDNTYIASLSTNSGQNFTNYKGKYTVIGSTFYCSYDNRDLITFTYKITKGNVVEGTLTATPYSSQPYEVRLGRQ